MRLRRKVMLQLLVLLAVALAPPLAPAAEPPAARLVRPRLDLARNLLLLDEGISLHVTSGWASAGARYGNALELVAPGSRGSVSAPEARTLVTVERRIDHPEALERLAQLAATHPGTVTYLAIGGWPAMRLRYSEPLPAEAERPGQGKERSISEQNRLAVHTVTAVAVGETVVRMSTTLAPGASLRRAREAEALAQRLVAPARIKARDTAAELHRLRTEAPSGDGKVPAPSHGGAMPGGREPRIHAAALKAPVLVGDGSETEGGVAMSGTTLIIANNSGTDVSHDGGATFIRTPSRSVFGFPTMGDPSIAVGRSGNVYQSLLGLPGAKDAKDVTGLIGCAVGVMSSGNSGAAFAFAGNAALCPPTGSAMCSPDMGKIASDRFTPSAGGGDQLYAVWRNFTVVGTGLPANCSEIESGAFAPALSCSRDSGSTWSAPVTLGGGDYPRVSVGGDGHVYVVVRDGGEVTLHKFTSCDQGLIELAGFPRRVTNGIDDPTCPLPGLDRCHPGLVTPTVTVDDTNPSHVYVAVARAGSGGTGNDDILVVDSRDGGLTWGTPVVVNANVQARRFMPWVCAAAGDAYVGWYDRRAAVAPGASSNDLTDFYLGAATTRNGVLVADGERNVTGAPDPQCASGWSSFGVATPPADPSDAESCSVQPQLAGMCLDDGGKGSGMRCDFSSTTCPSGEHCWSSVGAPKYGDYNGIACGPDRVLVDWASATPPKGFSGTAPPGIQVFSTVAPVDGTLSVVERVIPANDPGQFQVLVDGVAGTAGPYSLPVTSAHRVGEVAAPGTSLASYAVSVDGDCDSDGTVHFSALHPATCRITNVNRAYQQRVDACNAAEGQCMAEAQGAAQRQACVQEELACVDAASRDSLVVALDVVPAMDGGTFDLAIDGMVRLANARAGAATPAVTVSPGPHDVTQTATGGTVLGNYAIAVGGACSPSGSVTLNLGDQLTCTITNTRLPGTGADAILTVVNVVAPAGDAGRFDLRIDGVVRASGTGNGGTTGPVVLLEGTHTVDEVGAGGTNLASFLRTFGGDCDASGSVTLSAGQHRTCTITNQDELAACVAACNADEQACMSGAHTPADRQACIREKNDCVKACSPAAVEHASAGAGTFR